MADLASREIEIGAEAAIYFWPETAGQCYDGTLRDALLQLRRKVEKAFRLLDDVPQVRVQADSCIKSVPYEEKAQSELWANNVGACPAMKLDYGAGVARVMMICGTELMS